MAYCKRYVTVGHYTKTNQKGPEVVAATMPVLLPDWKITVSQSQTKHEVLRESEQTQHF